MAESFKPTNGCGMQTWDALKNSTMVAKEYVIDRPLVNIWSCGPAMTMTDTLWTATPGSAHPTYTEVNSSGILTPLCNANSEGFAFMWRIPAECDVTKAIDFRILWCDVTDAAAAGTATWTLLYKHLVAGTTAVAVAATALDTTIEACTNVAQYVPVWTTWGSIAATTLSAAVPGDALLGFKATVAISSVTDANPMLVQARYYRKYYQGSSGNYLVM
jgi:hypothetical protein